MVRGEDDDYEDEDVLDEENNEVTPHADVDEALVAARLPRDGRAPMTPPEYPAVVARKQAPDSTEKHKG